MVQKMLVGDRDTVLFLPAYEINGVPQVADPSTATGIPITAPTAALLNYFIDITTPVDAGSSWGGNVTCTILNDWTLEMKASDTKDAKTLCSVGDSEDLTFYNYDAKMNFLRDVDPSDTSSEFNLPFSLTNAPDVAYLVAHRLGYSHTDAAAIGQEWHFYYVWTDHAIPASSDGEYQAIGEAFIPKGILNFKFELAA